MKALALLVLVLVVAGTESTTQGNADEEDLYKKQALQALRWIRSTSVKTASGLVWPITPGETERTDPFLYSGSAGIVLFLLEAHRVTGDRAYLDDACAGADHILSVLESSRSGKGGDLPFGLYNGIAGLGFTLEEMFRATGKDRFRKGSRHVVELLGARARKVDGGVEWNTTTDIIRGSAGIGLFLLYAARVMDLPPAREVAVKAGKRLIDLGNPVEEGLKWSMIPGYPRLMPNFSHGTAGVAYFLATLYQATRKKPFLDAALKGAAYLESITRKTENGCLIFHHEPGGEDLFYLGWCHGPPGTARLFYRLHAITGNSTWLDRMKRSAEAILNSGIPEKKTPGFWNNAGMCCGSAGVAEFFLDMHRITSDRRYLAFARRMTRHILAAATPSEKGLKWIQAEHRVKPDFLQAQTGYMQGAAGIGLWLLRFHAFLKGAAMDFHLPDAPGVQRK